MKKVGEISAPLRSRAAHILRHFALALLRAPAHSWHRAAAGRIPSQCPQAPSRINPGRASSTHHAASRSRRFALRQTPLARRPRVRSGDSRREGGGRHSASVHRIGPGGSQRSHAPPDTPLMRSCRYSTSVISAPSSPKEWSRPGSTGGWS